MKLAKIIMFSMLMLTLAACATDKHAYNQQPQKIFEAVNAKYPNEKTRWYLLMHLTDLLRQH